MILDTYLIFKSEKKKTKNVFSVDKIRKSFEEKKTYTAHPPRACVCLLLGHTWFQTERWWRFEGSPIGAPTPPPSVTQIRSQLSLSELPKFARVHVFWTPFIPLLLKRTGYQFKQRFKRTLFKISVSVSLSGTARISGWNIKVSKTKVSYHTYEGAAIKKSVSLFRCGTKKDRTQFLFVVAVQATR